ncbi:MAG: ATP phosphoribosyltransferase [Gammaproteobacteria bacterium]
MQTNTRLRIAIQKKGRLFSDSMELLNHCGIKVRLGSNALFCHSENFALDFLLVRDDDIPTLVMDEVCDLGIVGENVLLEKALQQRSKHEEEQYEHVCKLGFGHCRLAIAVPHECDFKGIQSLAGLRIATSYPQLLTQFLNEHKIKAQVLGLSGSVEIAPRLGMAEAICDLVSTGRTLEENGLVSVADVIQSEAVLIRSKKRLDAEMQVLYELLLQRIQGVMQAQESKYIMFHAPKVALEKIKQLLPGAEQLTLLPLEDCEDKVAVHVVSPEEVFWNTLERLKAAGASSILVLPIEKMLQ